MASNEELIAEARAVGGCRGCELHGPSVIHRMADALEAAQVDLAARDAVIAGVADLLSEWSDSIDSDAVRAILAHSPADALDAVKAEAWKRGRISGASVQRRQWSDEPNAPEPVNPYRPTPTEGATP